MIILDMIRRWLRKRATHSRRSEGAKRAWAKRKSNAIDRAHKEFEEKIYAGSK